MPPKRKAAAVKAPAEIVVQEAEPDIKTKKIRGTEKEEAQIPEVKSKRGKAKNGDGSEEIPAAETKSKRARGKIEEPIELEETKKPEKAKRGKKMIVDEAGDFDENIEAEEVNENEKIEVTKLKRSGRKTPIENAGDFEEAKIVKEKPKRGKKAAPQVNNAGDFEGNNEPEVSKTPENKPKRGKKSAVNQAQDVEEVCETEKDKIVEEKPKRGKKTPIHNAQEVEGETEDERPKRGKRAPTNSTGDSEVTNADEVVITKEKPKRGRKVQANKVEDVPDKKKKINKEIVKKNDLQENGSEEESEVQNLNEDKNGNSEDEEKVEEEEVEEKPKKGKRSAAKKAEAPKKSARKPKADKEQKTTDEIEEKEPLEDKKPAKRGRAIKSAESDEPKTKKTKGPTQNRTETDYEELDFSCKRKNALKQEANFKISTWNVDGLRAWVKKGGLDYISYEDPDIICLQETKCSEDQLPDEIKEITAYNMYWISSDKQGYAGVGLLSKVKPMDVTYGLNIEEHDDEGRCITAEYEKFYLVNVYVPNAGRKLVTLPKRLEWNEAFQSYVNKLNEKKPVIICGDMNVAHEEIDLANPKTNKKNAGFTEEERSGMTDLLDGGFVDTFRKFYPEKKDSYTFWTYMMNSRGKNVGWRLDYFLVSERFFDTICDNVIRSEVYGSDHCPIVLFINI